LTANRLNAGAGETEGSAKGAGRVNGQGYIGFTANEELHLGVGFATAGNDQVVANGKLYS